ncbi:hypothetical protein BD413DRAFT_222819 [Trametes elegans]|nr:hypothetical protein BD413DRAFT_222819 [Trametes elegans]
MASVEPSSPPAPPVQFLENTRTSVPPRRSRTASRLSNGCVPSVHDRLTCILTISKTTENTSVLKTDLKKGFIVGGNSAGGNMTAIVTHEARDDPFFEGRQPTGQLLREPFVAHPVVYPEHFKSQLLSVDGNKDVPPFRSAVLYEMFGRLRADANYERYQPDPADPRSSPLLYPSHGGLPHAFIQAMELDNNAIVYAQALREAGVETRLEVYRGVSRGFHYLYPTIASVRMVLEGSVRGLAWLLVGSDVSWFWSLGFNAIMS